MLGSHGLHTVVQQLAARNHLALPARSPGSEPAPERPREEVCGRLGLVDPRHSALHSNLAAELVPVEEKRGARVLLELLSLPAFVIRVEDESPIVGFLH